MNEHQIELMAERRMDGADRAFIAGQIDQSEYDATVRGIDQWTVAELAKLPKREAR